MGAGAPKGPLASGSLTRSPSLGFFLGPGLPLGLGSPSGVRFDDALLEPGLGPGIPFRFIAVAGGASEPVAVGVPFVAGVGLESEGISEGEGSTT